MCYNLINSSILQTLVRRSYNLDEDEPEELDLISIPDT